jgi:hypothetical protein
MSFSGRDSKLLLPEHQLHQLRFPNSGNRCEIMSGVNDADSGLQNWILATLTEVNVELGNLLVTLNRAQ